MATFNEEIYALLNADATLDTLVGDAIYHESTPENKLKSVDGIIFGSNINTALDTVALDNYGDEYSLSVKVVSADALNIYTIGQAVKDLIQATSSTNIRSMKFDRDQYIYSDEDRIHILNLDFTVDYGNDESSYLPPALTTWAEMVSVYGIGYSYPQPTGQTTVYRTGDDADIEASVFTASVRAANGLKPRQSLSSFFVLNNNNAWGNTNRFTAEDGTQTYTANLVLDNYTGLMWHRTVQSTALWNDQIDNSLASTQGGFSDWFLPNYKQIETISDLQNTDNPDSIDYAPFNIDSILGASTTSRGSSSSYYRFMPRYNSNLVGQVKSSSLNLYLLCRKHY